MDTGGIGYGSTLQPLASDLVVGADNNLYAWHWSNRSWAGDAIVPKPAAGLLAIASGPTGIWGIDGNHVPTQLTECVGSFCVPYFWNASYHWARVLSQKCCRFTGWRAELITFLRL